MEHQEAIDSMASEKYLLGELTPELRGAYEEHLFSCPECASDALSGAAFVHHAKAVLPAMKSKASFAAARPNASHGGWFALLRPAVVVPVFASLIAVIAYQDLRVYPALESTANEPRVLPSATVLHGETRGGGALNNQGAPVIQSDPKLGTTLTLELPSSAGYASYRFDLYDSRNKLVWTHSSQNPGLSQDTISLWLPGRVKRDTYQLALTGITPSGQAVAVQQQLFELQTSK